MREHTKPNEKSPFGELSPILTMGDGPVIAPLERIYRSIVFSSKDFTETLNSAFLYAITVGWDDESYKELAVSYSWSLDDIMAMKELHRTFISLQHSTWR